MDVDHSSVLLEAAGLLWVFLVCLRMASFFSRFGYSDAETQWCAISHVWAASPCTGREDTYERVERLVVHMDAVFLPLIIDVVFQVVEVTIF